jgi:hypothetical protein
LSIQQEDTFCSIVVSYLIETMKFIPFETYFVDGKAVANAVSEYNRNENKSCRTIHSSGRQRQYVCNVTDCSFHLEVFCKQATNGKHNSHVTRVPEGYYYVSKFEPHC